MNKITVNSVALKAALEKSLSCVDTSNSFLPICDFVMFVADEEETYIQVTDVKNYVRYKLPFNSDEKGQMLISHIELKNYIKFLPDCPIVIEKEKVDDKYNGSSCILTANNDKVKIPGEDPEEFPQMEIIESDDTIEVDMAQLKELISKAHGFTDTDKNMVISNILLSTEKDDLIVYATDKHVAYKGVMDCHGTFGRHAFNPDIKDMLSIIDQEKIQISVSKYKFQITSHRAIITGILFSEKFPPVEQFFESLHPDFITLERQEITHVMKKAEIFTNDRSRQVRLNFNGQLEVSAYNLDMNLSFDTNISYKAEAPINLLIAFNIRLLLRSFSICTGDNIKMHYKAHDKPVYIVNEHESALVMPMDITKNND